MPEKSSPNALPAAYRLGLALSLALFLHTLLLSGIPSPKEEPTATHRESVRFELVAPGTLRTVADPSADLSPRRDAPRVTPFEIDPPEPAPLSKPEVVTSREPQTPAPTKATNTSVPRSEAERRIKIARVGIPVDDRGVGDARNHPDQRKEKHVSC